MLMDFHKNGTEKSRLQGHGAAAAAATAAAAPATAVAAAAASAAVEAVAAVHTFFCDVLFFVKVC